MVRSFRFLACLTLISLLNLSCSSAPDDQPELAEISGTVSLDGTPLEGVLVSFSPEKGRGSDGVTDSNGMYKLKYMHNLKGAVIGKHKVTIKTYVEDDSDPESANVKEIVPKKYHENSPLNAEVVAGENPPIDFALDSK